MKKRVRISTPSKYGTYRYGVQTSCLGLFWEEGYGTDTYNWALKEANKYVNAKIIYPPFPEEV